MDVRNVRNNRNNSGGNQCGVSGNHAGNVATLDHGEVDDVHYACVGSIENSSITSHSVRPSYFLPRGRCSHSHSQADSHFRSSAKRSYQWLPV